MTYIILYYPRDIILPTSGDSSGTSLSEAQAAFVNAAIMNYKPNRRQPWKDGGDPDLEMIWEVGVEYAEGGIVPGFSWCGCINGRAKNEGNCWTFVGDFIGAVGDDHEDKVNLARWGSAPMRKDLGLEK